MVNTKQEVWRIIQDREPVGRETIISAVDDTKVEILNALIELGNEGLITMADSDDELAIKYEVQPNSRTNNETDYPLPKGWDSMSDDEKSTWMTEYRTAQLALSLDVPAAHWVQDVIDEAKRLDTDQYRYEGGTDE